MLDGDTYATEYSFDCAALAAGSAIAATHDVMSGKFQRAMILPRPPGHHAFAGHGEGFCLFNNAAFAAREAINVFGLDRVLIVDWDVHHGNGTQSIFYDDPGVMYCSTHQSGIYPGSGRLDEVGYGAGLGMTVNVPLPGGTDDAGFLRVFDEVILPLGVRYSPQLLIISAGFDAHWRDPLAGMRASLAGFAQMTQRLLALANACCEGKTIVVLEGGYDFEVLACGVQNTLHLLADGNPANLDDPLGAQTSDPRTDDMVSSIIARARTIHGLP